MGGAVLYVLLCALLFAAVASANTGRMPNMGQSATAARKEPESSSRLVVCGVDGTVYTLRADTGDLMGLFKSGDSLVSSSTARERQKDGGTADTGGHSLTPHSQIVPGLDGLIYTLSSAGALDLLPVSAMDVVDAPVATCTDPLDPSCGLVMGTKKSRVFALDVKTGSVRWVQDAGDASRGFTKFQAMSHAESLHRDTDGIGRSPVLLQREDYSVRQVGIDSGEEAWNLTVAHFSALEFDFDVLDDSTEAASAQLGRHNNQKIFASRPDNLKSPPPTLPRLFWSSDGSSIAALDPATSEPLWTRKLDSVVAAIYGVDNGVWASLDIVSEDELKGDDDGMMAAFDNNDLGLVTYQGPGVSEMLSSSRLGRVHDALFITPAAFLDDVCDPDEQPPSSMEELPTSTSQNFTHRTEEGLFLTWQMLAAGATALAILLAFFGRIVYVRLKVRWYKKLINTPNALGPHTDTPMSPPIMSLASTSSNIKTATSMPALSLDETSSAPTAEPKILPESDISRISSAAIPAATPHRSDQSPSQSTVPPTPPTPTVGEINGIPLVRYSRYSSEFTEKSALGRGGFGTVYRCLNALDGRDYAIKKIRISADSERSLARKLNKVMREVKILALLDHPNIVRYYTAWLEVDTGDVENVGDGSTWEETSVTSKATITARRKNKVATKKSKAPVLRTMASEESDLGFDWDRGDDGGDRDGDRTKWSDDVESSTNPTIEEEGESKAVLDRSRVGVAFDRTRGDEFGLDVEDEEDEESKWSVDHSRLDDGDYIDMSNMEGSPGRTLPHQHEEEACSVEQRYILYIQMMYCSGKTLRDFLTSPEAREGGTSGERKTLGISVPHALELFGQVVRGVKYVHGHGLIHRDLKPSNCFMEGGTVKIGDFGLSRESGGGSTTDNSADVSFDAERSLGTTNTAGVGTYIYASPEQIASRDYDSSTDVYSLGVMLFELVNPMYSAHERSLVLTGVHEGNFPKSWLDAIRLEYGGVHDLIRCMVSNRPGERPSAEEVAGRVDAMLGKLTVLSLDRSKSRGDGSILLRVEAKAEGGGDILKETVALIKKTEPSVAVKQYGLRSGDDGGVVMEFAIGFDDGGHEAVNRLVEVMSGVEGIGTVRQVSEKHSSFDET